MDRRHFDGGSAYFQRSDNLEEYATQRNAHMNRDWEKRRVRDSWESSVDRFLVDHEERRDRERSPRSRSRDRERRERRLSPLRLSPPPRDRRYLRDYRSPPRREDERDRYERELYRERRRIWEEEEARYREYYAAELRERDRRGWDDDIIRDQEYRKEAYSASRQSRRDEWLEKVWGKSDGYESSSSHNNDSGDNDKGRLDWADEIPGPGQNRTIIIRGLAQHITENDIRQEIAKCRLDPSDIRMIRRKNGTSRGFAFVEFATTEEAVQCMEMRNGELMLNNHYRAIMQFSLPINSRDRYYSDWHCKCSAHNFKRRDFCYKCGCTRENALADEVSVYPTSTVLLRGLDTLTTESSVLETIQDLSNLPIKSVRIGRDPVTNTSLGVCYIEMNYVMDATFLHNALLMAAPVIDEKTPTVSYYKSDAATYTANAQATKAGNVAVEAAQWSHQSKTKKTGSSSTPETSQYTLKDVSRLAEYSANLYAKTPEEKTTYLAYYQQYYHKLISDGEQISLPADALSANPAKPSDSLKKDAMKPLSETPDGSGSKTYSVPDVSTYQYDKTSGYYYDPYTTLYYDANSQYYYNPKITKFLYWDSVKNTYLPAPTAAAASASMVQAAPPMPLPDTESNDQKDDDKKNKDKINDKDKVKVAKRIAKDMEKWAKTLNHKKEIAKQNLVASAAIFPSLKAQGAADIGFAVLERKDIPIPSGMAIHSQVEIPVLAQPESSLVAAYGQGSDSEEEVEDVEGEDKQHTDWVKLACLLCKRQFPSKEVLMKHQQLSDLHKQNLNKWYKSRGLDPDDAQQRTLQYRDRAKERRLKYGEPDKPHPNKLKETYIKSKEATKSYEEPTKLGIGAENRGNKLLQKMGWQEGMGLGKKNQGRTTIIEAERRSATAGLGTKTTGVVPGPGETYKDCVRKMMYIRYQEIDEPN